MHSNGKTPFTFISQKHIYTHLDSITSKTVIKLLYSHNKIWRCKSAPLIGMFTTEKIYIPKETTSRPPPQIRLDWTWRHPRAPLGNRGKQPKYTVNSVAHRRQFLIAKSTRYKVNNACISHSASDEVSLTTQVNKIDAWYGENKQHIYLLFLKPSSFLAWQGQQVIWGHMPFYEAGV
jgi:hypothetical protein